MACEICGRSNCCRSFHTLEEQKRFDDTVAPYKEHIESEISSGLKGLEEYYKEDIKDDEQYVKLSDV